MDARRQLRIGCEFEYEAAVDTPAVLQVQPYEAGPAIVRTQSWTTEPDLLRHAFTDLYGNSCQRLTLPAGIATIRYTAVASAPDATERVDPDAVEVPVVDLPDSALVYTTPSRYVLSDVLGDEAWRLFGSHPPGYRRVQAIVDFVHEHLEFVPGSSTPLTTAVDVYEARRGVCRDYAHLSLAFCRALNIPARYVFGYLPEIEVEPLPEPMDFAAWIEVYLAGDWFTFDPRNNQARKGRVVIGRGRDALDVAMVTTFGGPVLNRMEVWAEEVGAGEVGAGALASGEARG